MPAQTRNASAIAGCVSAAFLGVVILLAMAERLGWLVVFVYIVMSIVAYFSYKHDKRAAQIGGRRIAEWNLITLGLIGGWPGALFARHRFRHKTSKVSFRVEYWLSVAMNVAALAWLVAQ